MRLLTIRAASTPSQRESQARPIASCIWRRWNRGRTAVRPVQANNDPGVPTREVRKLPDAERR